MKANAAKTTGMLLFEKWVGTQMSGRADCIKTSAQSLDSAF
jgi:hypothetical protein